MYNSIQPLFKRHHVFIVSNVIESKREERLTKSGGALIYTIAKCQFKFYTTDGSFVESVLEGEAMDSGDKSTNKAMSTALKYALMQMFLIPTEERIDTEYDTHEVAPKKVVAAIIPPVNELEILCRKQYESKDDLLLTLDSCETVGQLNTLYHINSKLVEANNIREQFTKRKNDIRQTA